MAETCPFSETSRCRDRDETEALDLRDRDETETLKNSVSRLSRDRDMSRDTIALLRTSLGRLSPMLDHTIAAREGATCASMKSLPSCKQTLRLHFINGLSWLQNAVTVANSSLETLSNVLCSVGLFCANEVDFCLVVVRVHLNLYCLFCFISLQRMCNNSFSQIFSTITSKTPHSYFTFGNSFFAFSFVISPLPGT